MNDQTDEQDRNHEEQLQVLIVEGPATGTADRRQSPIDEKIVHSSIDEGYGGTLDVEKVSDVQPSKSLRKWWLQDPLKLNPPPIPVERNISVERSANYASQAVFWWMGNLMHLGYKRTLLVEDIPTLAPQRRNNKITDRLTADFQKRVKRGDKRPLLKALNGTFFYEFWFAGISQLVAICLLTLSPLILKYLIVYAADAYYGDSIPIGRGVGLAVGMASMIMVASLFINQYIYRSMISGGMARAALISMIYAKSQVISARAKGGSSKGAAEPNGKGSKPSLEEGGWSDGRVANLMSTDTYRVDQAATWVHVIWITVIQLVIVIVQLCINLGASGLAGFALLAACGPLITWATSVLARRRGRANKITDERITLTQEVLQAIRFVKYFAWEESFLEKLNKLRTLEIRQIQFLLGVRSVINAIAMCLPVFAAIFAFLAYSYTHVGFDPANVFPSLALFNSLRMPLNMLPTVVGQTIDAYVSIQRIESYLTAEEEEEKRQIDLSLKEAIVLRNASFTWESAGPSKEDGKQEKSSKSNPSEGESPCTRAEHLESSKPSTSDEDVPFSLQNLNLAMSREELIAVVGPVGSGKTSLLAAIAGEMRASGGTVLQGSRMAYCAQQAWIQNATVRDNIIFGQEYDPILYKKVTEACALKEDFKMFTHGDRTEVGERGITLSGGQKQRISLARAIYFKADVVVLDDPLSAVDANVGRHIFDEAICGLLTGKCRILATHQLHVLHRCNRIVYMLDGKFQAVGTYEELIRTNPEFAQMLSQTATEATAQARNNEDGLDPAEMEKITRTETRTSQHPGEAGILMTKEDQEKNGIKWKVYRDYIKASGSILNAPLVIALVCLAQAAQVVGTIWLSYWTSDRFGFSTGAYIGIYAGLGFVQAVLLCTFSLVLTVGGTEASKNLLQKAMASTMRAPMYFFDTTPLGRIINRFSKDVDVTDNFLTEAMRMYFISLATVASIFILIMVYYPYFIAALIPMIVVVYFAAAYYRSTAREIKRHEAVLRSVVFSCFGEAVSGASVIKAYDVQDLYRAKLNEHIDSMNAAYYLTFSAQCWLSVRLDVVGNILALITALLVVTDKFKIDPSLAGVILGYVIQVIGMIQFTVRQLALMENSMNSTERVLYYANDLPSEVVPATQSHEKPAKSWPQTGDINFVDVEMRYRPGLPLVLKGLSLHIRGGERIGVVGRTGAGKSSIMSCLFRLVELHRGRIAIDGIDIAALGLYDLRSKISIIPQDPTLFRGTVRSNLDPMGEFSDLTLWNVLRQAHLVGDEAQQQLEEGTNKIKLDGIVVNEGLNLSLGQRQLMALARALLRDSRIIVCDEATSSVDEETDRKIQRTMQMGFKGKTVLTIAHRLRTILLYDRIVVMDAGTIAECGPPLELWKKEGSIFRSICEKSRIREEDFEGSPLSQ